MNPPEYRTCSRLLILFFLLVHAGFSGVASAQPVKRMGWPSFHGPDRTNKSLETGLLRKWPESGPRLLWTASGLGEGYSSVSIADGRIYTAGMSEGKGFIFAFDLAGKLVWKTANGEAWTAQRAHAQAYSGSRSTPTFDNGIVYHLGETGRLAAFDAKNGKEIWAKDIHREYEAEMPTYGYSESVLIDGDRLFCSPAGSRAFLICLNKKTGAVIWESSGIAGRAGYASPIIADFGGYRQVLGMSSELLFGADSRTGKVLWTTELRNNRNNNCTDPIFFDGHVFAASGYGRGSMLLKLAEKDKAISATPVWSSELLDNHHGAVILHNNHLYGSGHNARGWFCLDFMTGKELWKAPGKGSLTYADGMLYLYEENGTMKLVRADPEKFDETGSFPVPNGGKGMFWAHPVVCDARLYLRHADNLYAYDVKGK